jgi:hypothetical protein
LPQFQNALVILLLIATAVSAGLWFVERDAVLPYEAFTILGRAFQRDHGLHTGSRAEQAVAASDVG